MEKVNRTRPHILSIRMSDEELKKVKKRIKESGRTQRDFVRMRYWLFPYEMITASILCCQSYARLATI